jgi:hypothetical protein
MTAVSLHCVSAPVFVRMLTNLRRRHRLLNIAAD